MSTEQAVQQPSGPTIAEAAAEVFGTDAVVTPIVETEAVLEVANTETNTEAEVEDPKAARIGARVSAAVRAERKATAERNELRAERERHEQAKAGLDAREKRIRLIEEDPIKAFAELKLDPKTFLEKLSGEYKPEAIASKEVAALTAKVTELEQQAKSRETAENNAKARAQVDQAWSDASSAFITHVAAQPEKYPNLCEQFTEAEATELAYAKLTEVVGRTRDGKPLTRSEAYRAQHGDYPDDEVIAEFIDGIAKQRVESKAKSGWRKQGERPASQLSESSPNGDQKPVPPVKGTIPRTLTAREASTRAAAPKPWSQEAADEESIRLIQAGLKA